MLHRYDGHLSVVPRTDRRPTRRNRMTDQAPSSESRPNGGSTLGTGAPAPSDRNSLTVGADGPILLHDHHFIEQMAHFNRERVPERNVHAKGSGAFGYLEITEDVRQHKSAAAFQPGTPNAQL